MKTLVTYQSSTGFTKRYAEIIGSRTGAHVMELKEATAGIMGEYDLVVHGGGLYAGSLSGIKKARALFRKSSAKKFAVFAVGAMPPDSPTMEETWKRNLTEEEMKTVPHFYMLGGLDYQGMKIVHKIMMKVAITGVKQAKNRDEWAEAFLRTCAGSFDAVDPKYAEPLVDLIKGR